MSSVSKYLCALLAVMLAVLGMACSTEPVEPDVHTASIERLCEETDWTAEQAQGVLSLLATLGHEGEVMLAYPATDKQKAAYYHIWIGESSVDVYLNEDGTVARVYQGGISIYGDDAVDTPNEDKPLVDVPEEKQPTEDEIAVDKPAADKPAVDEPDEEKPDEDQSVEVEPDADKPTEDEPSSETTLTFDELTEQVTAGSNAKLSVCGTPGEEYRIEVHYKSGISKAKGLEPQVAADDGLLCWTWKVSARTTPGEYKIRVVRVSDESDVLELSFKVK